MGGQHNVIKERCIVINKTAKTALYEIILFSLFFIRLLQNFTDFILVFNMIFTNNKSCAYIIIKIKENPNFVYSLCTTAMYVICCNENIDNTLCLYDIRTPLLCLCF